MKPNSFAQVEANFWNIALANSEEAAAHPHQRIDVFLAPILTKPWPTRAVFIRSAYEVFRKYQAIDAKNSHTNHASVKAVALRVLAELFRHHPIDAAYRHKMLEGGLWFTEIARLNMRVESAYMNWRDYNEEDRQEAVKYVANLHDRAYSTEDMTFEPLRGYTFQNEPESPSSGWYFRNSMNINTSIKHGWNDFSKVMCIVTHEKRHHYRDQIQEAYLYLDLPNTSPYCREGMSLARLTTRLDKKVYIEAETDRNAYWNHPCERDARESEEAAERVNRLLRNARREAEREAYWHEMLVVRPDAIRAQTALESRRAAPE